MCLNRLWQLWIVEMKRKLVPLAAMFVSGCVSAEVGSGDLALSPCVQSLYAAYKNANEPIVFAVAEDGSKAAFTWCPSTICDGGEESFAVGTCQILADDKRCFIYAREGKVVWNGAVSESKISADQAVSAEQCELDKAAVAALPPPDGEDDAGILN